MSVEPRKPEVLHSEARAVHRDRPPGGRELSDHQVHERAWLVVADGAIEVQAGEETVDGRAGSLFVFEPNERHEFAPRPTAACSSCSARGPATATLRRAADARRTARSFAFHNSRSRGKGNTSPREELG